MKGFKSVFYWDCHWLGASFLFHVFVPFVTLFLRIAFFFFEIFLSDFFFVPAYQVWRRIEFPRLLCSGSYAAIFNYLLLFYLPFDPLFCRTYGGFRLLGFDFIPFFFYFYIVCRVVDVITIFSLFSTLFVFFFFALSLNTVHCIACRAHC